MKNLIGFDNELNSLIKFINQKIYPSIILHGPKGYW